MSNNAPDYENDLVFEPKSADDLNKQGRQSDVLIAALDKCEKLEKKLKIATEDLYVIAHNHSLGFGYIEYAEKSLEKIKELDK